MLRDADRAALIGLARDTVASAVLGGPSPEPPDADVFRRVAGAFVTLTIRGELRGCIGQIEPRDPVGAVIVHCAAAAALEDPRFSPVSPIELPSLGIEVSVLTSAEEVTDVDRIEVGRHGLIVAQNGHRGLLLPQVATDHGWSREQFLAETCRKAGLPKDAWQRGAKIYSFEAEVFGDERQSIDRGAR
jgi:AmmeMemoRadiSam system protein A